MSLGDPYRARPADFARWLLKPYWNVEQAALLFGGFAPDDYIAEIGCPLPPFYVSKLDKYVDDGGRSVIYPDDVTGWIRLIGDCRMNGSLVLRNYSLPTPERDALPPHLRGLDLPQDEFEPGLTPREWIGWAIGVFRTSVAPELIKVAGLSSDAVHTRDSTASKHSSEKDVREAIDRVYELANEQNVKPPNVKEVVQPVQQLLRDKGRQASGNTIIRIASEKHFQNRRREPGATLAGTSLRAFSHFTLPRNLVPD